MTLLELLTELREDYLDDTVAPYLWGDPTLKRFLNRAQVEAAMRQRLLVDETTAAICEVTLVADQASYPLDSRIVLVEDIRLDNIPLTKRTKAQLDRIEPAWHLRTGTVDTYLQNDLTITLLPTPTAAEDGKKLYLRVWRLPAESMVNNADTPEIPLQHHRDLLWFALGEAFSLPDEDTQNTQRADTYYNRFDRVFGSPMPADVLAHRRREASVSYVGSAHTYHGRRSHRMSAERAFDFED